MNNASRTKKEKSKEKPCTHRYATPQEKPNLPFEWIMPSPCRDPYPKTRLLHSLRFALHAERKEEKKKEKTRRRYTYPQKALVNTELCSVSSRLFFYSKPVGKLPVIVASLIVVVVVIVVVFIVAFVDPE